jgi:hypothetical protein
VAVVALVRRATVEALTEQTVELMVVLVGLELFTFALL